MATEPGRKKSRKTSSESRSSESARKKTEANDTDFLPVKKKKKSSSKATQVAAAGPPLAYQPHSNSKAGIVLSTAFAISMAIVGVYQLNKEPTKTPSGPDGQTPVAATPPIKPGGTVTPKTPIKPRVPAETKPKPTKEELEARKEKWAAAVKAVELANDFEIDFPKQYRERLRLWKEAMASAGGTRLSKRCTRKVLELQEKVDALDGKGKPFPGLAGMKATAFDLALGNRYNDAIKVLNDFKDKHQGFYLWKEEVNGMRAKFGEQRRTFFGLRKRGVEQLIRDGMFAEAKAELEFLLAQGPENMRPYVQSRLNQLPELEALFRVARVQQEDAAKQEHDRQLRKAFGLIEKPMRKRDVAAARRVIQSILNNDKYERIHYAMKDALPDMDKVEQFLADARANLKSLEGKETTVGGILSQVHKVEGDTLDIESQGMKMKKRFKDLREREIIRLAWGDANERDPILRLSAGLLWLFRYETIMAEREFDISEDEGMDVHRYMNVIGVLGREMSSDAADDLFKEFRHLWSRKKWLAAGRIGRDLELRYSFARAFQRNKDIIRTARAVFESFGPNPILHPAKFTIVNNAYVDCIYDFESPVQMLDWGGDGPQPGFWVRDGKLTLIGLTSKPHDPRVWLKAGLMDITRFEFDVIKGDQGSDYVGWEIGWTPPEERGLLLKFSRPNLSSIMSRKGGQLAYNPEWGFEDNVQYHVVTSRAGPETVVTANGRELLRGEDPFAMPGRTLVVSAGYHAHLDNFRFRAAINHDWVHFAAKQRDAAKQMIKAITGTYESEEWVSLLIEGRPIGWDFEKELWKHHDGSFCLENFEGSAEFPALFKNFELKGKVHMEGDVDVLRVYWRRFSAKFQSQCLEIMPFRSRAKLRWNYMTKKKPVVPLPEALRIDPIENGKWYTFHIIAGSEKTTVKFDEKVLFEQTMPSYSAKVGLGGMGGHIHFKDIQIKKLP